MKRIAIIIICSMLCVFAAQAQRKIRKETHKGDNNYSRQQYGKAEEQYKKAIILYNESVANDRKKELKEEDKTKEAFFNLANTYYRQNRWDDAIKAYQDYHAVEQDEDKQSQSWSNIGNSYLHKAIEPKPAKPQGQGQGGAQQGQQQDQLPRKEDLNKSMDAYKNALRRNPLDDEARYNLAVVQKMIKDQQDNEGGGGSNNQQQQQQQQDKQEQDKQEQDKNDKNDEKQDKGKQDNQQQRNENQMSRESIEQILNALEQEEKETQARVQQQKANEQKRKNSQNRQQDKDW